jgi:hypothetical protein
MDQFVEGKNPYTILGLEQGEKSTLDEIKKVKSLEGAHVHDCYGYPRVRPVLLLLHCCCCTAAASLLLLPAAGLPPLSTGQAS